MLEEDDETKQLVTEDAADFDAPHINERDQIPKDHYSATYIIMVLCGAGFLFPWNNTISALDYYMLKCTSCRLLTPIPNKFEASRC
jgi:hypothetical protein